MASPLFAFARPPPKTRNVERNLVEKNLKKCKYLIGKIVILHFKKKIVDL